MTQFKRGDHLSGAEVQHSLSQGRLCAKCRSSDSSCVLSKNCPSGARTWPSRAQSGFFHRLNPPASFNVRSGILWVVNVVYLVSCGLGVIGDRGKWQKGEVVGVGGRGGGLEVGMALCFFVSMHVCLYPYVCICMYVRVRVFCVHVSVSIR